MSGDGDAPAQTKETLVFNVLDTFFNPSIIH